MACYWRGGGVREGTWSLSLDQGLREPTDDILWWSLNAWDAVSCKAHNKDPCECVFGSQKVCS